MRESSNCVEHAENENIHFPIVPHTFLKFDYHAPRLRQTRTITQKHPEVLIPLGFWIPRAKTLPVSIFKVLARLEVILCTKNFLF